MLIIILIKLIKRGEHELFMEKLHACQQLLDHDQEFSLNLFPILEFKLSYMQTILKP